MIEERTRITDIIDKAALLTAQYNEDALAAHHAKPNLSLGTQRVVNGAVFCVDCDEAIAPGRLKAMPGCIRCVTCQQIVDEGGDE